MAKFQVSPYPLLKRQAGEHLKPHVISHDDAKGILERGGDEVRRPPENDPELIRHPEYKEHFYQRRIGGEWHTKLMIGTPGKKIQ